MDDPSRNRWTVIFGTGGRNLSEQVDESIGIGNLLTLNVILMSLEKEIYLFVILLGGLITGALEAVTKASVNNEDSLEGVETTCLSMGHNSCIFEVRKRSEWDINDSKISEEFSCPEEELVFIKKVMTLAALLRSPSKVTKAPTTEFSIFMKKKSFQRPFEFRENGVVSLFDVKSLITPIDIVVLLYHHLQKYGKKTDEIFYQVGQLLGERESKRIIATFQLDKTNANQMKLLFDQIGIFGLGRVEIAKLDKANKKYIFRVYNSPADHYKHLIGLSKNKIDFLLAGIFSGIIKEIYNEGVDFVEESCIASGSQACIFSNT